MPFDKEREHEFVERSRYKTIPEVLAARLETSQSKVDALSARIVAAQVELRSQLVRPDDGQTRIVLRQTVQLLIDLRREQRQIVDDELVDLDALLDEYGD